MLNSEYTKLYTRGRWVICHFGDVIDVAVADAVDAVDLIDAADLITSVVTGAAFGFKTIIN